MSRSVSLIIEDALAAGRAAYEGRAAEIASKPPAYEVYDADVFTGERIPADKGGRSWALPDLCGFAWLIIPDGRCPLVAAIKADPRFRIDKRYNGSGHEVRVREFGATQSITTKEAAYRAFAEVVNQYPPLYGKYRVYADSRLD